MAEIILSKKEVPFLKIPLTKTATRLGRSAECEVCLADPAISRVHLVFYQIDGSYLAKKVGQTPVLFEGKEIESLPLKEGSQLQLGEWNLIFHVNSAPTWNEEETRATRAAPSEVTAIAHASILQGQTLSERWQLKIEFEGQVRFYPILQDVTVIGKSKTCDLVLSDSYCSEKHAKLLFKRGRFQLLDLGSTNGTFLKGVQVNDIELKEEAPIQIGKTQLKIESVTEKRKIVPLEKETLGPLVGKSSKMREVYRLVQLVAPTVATVCILGETGTGKELVARAVHDLSPRYLKPFVAINCGAISKELIASELFGHEKGAFTGAQQQRKGAFEQAHGGTLFLDEMGELPLDLQPALLRVLETGKIRRVGAEQEVNVDVRVICATHRDLTQSVRDGKFREDLFFRLFVFPLFLPALRERKEDIPLLAQTFLEQMQPPQKKMHLSEEAQTFLKNQNWKGNVRELKNTIQRALLLSSGEVIGLQELQHPFLEGGHVPEIHGFSESSPQLTKLEQLERELILKELQANQQNKKATAESLGMAKSTLYEKLRAYGIPF